MTDFDSALRQIGEFGKAQILLYALVCLTGVPLGGQHLSSVFTGASQQHWCRVEGLDALSPQQRRRLAIPRLDDGSFDSCRRYDVDFRNFSGNATDWLPRNTTTSLCHSWEFDTTEIYSTIVSQYDLVCDQEFLNRLLVSIYMGGNLVGVFVGGMVADAFGRMRTIAIASGVHAACGVLAALVPSLFVHFAARFLVSATGSTAFTSGFVYAMEVVGPRYRMEAGVMVQSWFAAGFMLISVLAFFIRNHIVLQLILSVQPLFFVAYFWLLPESPRWLVARGRHVEAEQICRRIAKGNGRTLPAEFSFADATAADKTDPQVEQTVGKVKDEVSKSSVLDLLRTPRMRVRSLNIFFNWFVVSITYYGLSLNAEGLGGSIYLNSIISAAVELPAYVLSCLLLKLFGRVRPMVAALVLSGIACSGAAFVSVVWLRVTLAMIGKFSVSAAFAMVYVYSAEVFPTVVRNVGIGAASMHARIGALLAPQIVLLSDLWQPLPFLLIGLLCLATGLLSLLLPETLNQPLPETLEDGENFGAKKVAPMQVEIDLGTKTEA